MERMMKMEKMEIYDKVRAVPEQARRSFNNGRFKGTDINPMWRIKKLTEMFGPCGSGWYIDNVEQRWERLDDKTVIAIVDLELFVKFPNGEWSKPIYGTGGNTLVSNGKPSDEGYKMAYTDAISVACKALGIGADVYFERDADSKYAQYYGKRDAENPPEDDAQVPDAVLCERCGKPIVGVTACGTSYTPGELIANSKLKYGGCFCFNCMRILNGKGKGNEGDK